MRKMHSHLIKILNTNLLVKCIYFVLRMFFHWKPGLIIDFFRKDCLHLVLLSLVELLSLHPSLPQISYLIEPHGFVINCMIRLTEWKCKSSHSAHLHACQIWKSIYLTSAWAQVWERSHFCLSSTSFLEDSGNTDGQKRQKCFVFLTVTVVRLRNAFSLDSPTLPARLSHYNAVLWLVRCLSQSDASVGRFLKPFVTFDCQVEAQGKINPLSYQLLLAWWNRSVPKQLMKQPWTIRLKTPPISSAVTARCVCLLKLNESDLFYCCLDRCL